MKNKIDKL